MESRVASIGKKKQFFSYAHAFLVAADSHATAAKEKGIDGEVDGMMCVIALQNSAVGAIKVVGKGHVAALEFFDDVPDLKDVRDMLTHFDDYVMGKGDLQKSPDGKKGPFGWMPMWNSDETLAILNRAKGVEVPTLYEVPIHTALKSTAVLVAAAAKFLEVELSPLLKKLTEAE
jgi:hypothetical protein